MNNFFANIGKLDKIPENVNLKEHLYRVTPTMSSIEYQPNKLEMSFNKVFKKGKAGGHDGISSKEALLVGDTLLSGIHQIAKSSFSTNQFPSTYKIAKVQCIFKKGSMQKCENYRPISLLCLPGKLLEGVVASEIDNHIYRNNLLTNHQWGF